jgi:hypothetical protein
MARLLTLDNDSLTFIHGIVVTASAWLRASPHHRVVLVRDYGVAVGAPLLAMAAIRCDVEACRATRAPATHHDPVGAQLLHDVLSTLHGRDRRLAGHVCMTWRRAACDPLLPVADDDVRAWTAPCLAEMKRWIPYFTPMAVEVKAIWIFTKRWLQGCL